MKSQREKNEDGMSQIKAIEGGLTVVDGNKEPLQLYKKLMKITEAIPGLKETSVAGYKVLGSKVVISAVKKASDEENVMYFYTMSNVEVEYLTIGMLKKGSVNKDIFLSRVKIEVNWKIVDIDSGQYLTVKTFAGWEKESLAMAIGGALTYCQKQLFKTIFLIATDENDPDFDSDHIKEFSNPTPSQKETRYEMTTQERMHCKESAALLLEICNGDKDAYKLKLKEISHKESFNDLTSSKHVFGVCSTISTLHQKMIENKA